MQYGFRTREEDKELDIVLSSFKGKNRTNFIREALYFYITNKNIIEQISKNISEIEQISKDITEIKEMIKNQPISTTTINKNITPLEPNNNEKKTNEEIIKRLANNFLNK